MATMSRKAWGMGSAFRRRDGKYVCQVYHRGKARQFYGRTPAEARDKARAFVPTEKSSSIPSGSLAEFVAEWLSIMQAKQSARTHEGYEAICRLAILPVMGDKPLDQIGRQDVEAAISVWTQTRHPRTVHHYRAALRAILSSAVDWGYIAVNPAKGKITMPRIPQSRAAAFSERDEEKLLAYLRGEG